jgi:uncharacterized membrane-anchored protein
VGKIPARDRQQTEKDSKMKNFMRIILLALPLMIVAGWAGYHEVNSRIGTEVIFKVRGYDPRDLLAGHYLTYEVVYDPPIMKCENNKPVFACLATGEVSSELDEECEVSLRGTCYWGRFRGNIERFYVPEAYARDLDRALRFEEVDAKIKVFVTNKGVGYVKEMYFNDLTADDFLAQPSAEHDADD